MSSVCAHTADIIRKNLKILGFPLIFLGEALAGERAQLCDR